MKWVLSPLLYAAAAPVVFVASVAWFSFLQFRPLGRFEIFVVLLGSVAAGSLALVLLTIGLVRLEHLRPPTTRDHLRHCAWLYAGMALLTAIIVVTYDNEYCCALQWTLALLLDALAVYAAGINALTFFILAHRSRP